jgi:hypothetical protein
MPSAWKPLTPQRRHSNETVSADSIGKALSIPLHLFVVLALVCAPPLIGAFNNCQRNMSKIALADAERARTIRCRHVTYV